MLKLFKLLFNREKSTDRNKYAIRLSVRPIQGRAGEAEVGFCARDMEILFNSDEMKELKSTWGIPIVYLLADGQAEAEISAQIIKVTENGRVISNVPIDKTVSKGKMVFAIDKTDTGALVYKSPKKKKFVCKRWTKIKLKIKSGTTLLYDSDLRSGLKFRVSTRLAMSGNKPTKLEIKKVKGLPRKIRKNLVIEKDFSGERIPLQVYLATRNLKKGDKGYDVVRLQYLLAQKGYQVWTDGIYGESTVRAVKELQKLNRLNENGEVGKEEIRKIQDA